MTEPIQQFLQYLASFHPKNTDDLKKGAESMIGAIGVWRVMWIIDEGRYSGQWAMTPLGQLGEDCLRCHPENGFSFVPECDLKIHYRVPLGCSVDPFSIEACSDGTKAAQLTMENLMGPIFDANNPNHCPKCHIQYAYCECTDELPDTVPMSELEQMRERKNAAYLERNRVVALLARLFPSGIGKTAIEGWSEEWHGCVYIDTPAGQLSWHYHDSQAFLFEGLPQYTKPWDGHTTEEKYERIESLYKNGVPIVAFPDLQELLRKGLENSSVQISGSTQEVQTDNEK